jgi:hypothetical protein
MQNCTKEKILDIKGLKDTHVICCDLSESGADIIGFYYKRQKILLIDERNSCNYMLIERALDLLKSSKKVIL